LYDNAVADLTKAIDINTNYNEAYYYRGVAYKALSLKSKAVADFQKFISLSQDQGLMQSAKDYINELSTQY